MFAHSLHAFSAAVCLFPPVSQNPAVEAAADSDRALAAARAELVEAAFGLAPDAARCGWLAPNPAQGMESAFSADGLLVRDAGEGAWSLDLTLAAWGRPDALLGLDAAAPRVASRSAEYLRGPVAEWYVNHPEGLEQGFLVERAPPAGAGPLTLALAVASGEGLALEVLPSGRDALFLDSDGRPVLHYDGLRAFDADGVELTAWLEAEAGGDQLAIRVDDRGARYPIHVDPWIKTEEAKLIASSPSAGELFGSELALSGDTAVIGAPGNDQAGLNAGTAYVYVRSGSSWSLQQQLFGSDTTTGDQFGAALALEGDTLVVGAASNDLAETDAGAAYVFVRSGTSWSQEAQLTAADAEDADFFGISVALDGDTALVGTRSAEGVAITPPALDHDPVSGRTFAAEGGVLYQVDPVRGFATAIGSIGFTNVEGLAYDSVGGVLYGSDNATDQLITINTSTGAGTAIGTFGLGYTRVNALAFDSVGGTLYGVDNGTDELLTINTSSGAASAVGLVGFAAVQGLTFDANSGTLYGSDVFSDQLITINTSTGAGTAVGSLGYGAVRGLAFDVVGGKLYCTDVGVPELLQVNTSTGMASSAASFRGQLTGSAYAFTRSGTVWSEEQKLLASEMLAGGRFGGAVSLSGDTALVGSQGDGELGASAGAAYVFTRSGVTWSEQQKLLAGDGATGDLFGAATALVDDTAAVAAIRDDLSGGFDQGSVYVFSRTGTSWSQDQKVSSSEAADLDLFGSALALSGNTLLVGVPQADLSGGFDHGTAFVFVRSGTWLEFQKFVAADARSSDIAGTAVALDGETALVGAPSDDHASGFPGNLNGQGSVYEFEVCPAPVNYCTAGFSASGCQASISSSGIPSGTAPSGFFATASNVEGSKDGLFFFSTNGRQANSWGNGTSFQCVVPPVYRGGLLVGTGTDGQCDGFFAQDLNALWCPSCPQPLKNPGIGATVQVQLWYRDPLSTASQTTSLSNALEFCVGP